MTVSPTARFNLAVRALLLGLVKNVPDARPIISSNPLVEVGYVTSPVGTALPLVNWATTGNQTVFFMGENVTRITISLAGRRDSNVAVIAGIFSHSDFAAHGYPQASSRRRVSRTPRSQAVAR